MGSFLRDAAIDRRNGVDARQQEGPGMQTAHDFDRDHASRSCRRDGALRCSRKRRNNGVSAFAVGWGVIPLTEPPPTIWTLLQW